MKKLLLSAFSVLILLLLTSCIFIADGSDDGYTAGGSISYSDGVSGGTYYIDDNTYVEVIPKTTQWITHDSTSVYITLDANSTTGYEWVAEIDGKSIYLDSSSYTPYSTGLVGTPGIWKAVFETSGYDGTSYVTLRYVRPWDTSDIAGEHRFSVRTYYATISDLTILY